MSLHVSNVSKSYGDVPILQDVSFILNAGDRWGLIGPNGCGKTTLLRIIAGQELPDAGSVAFAPADLRVGYLQQALPYADGDSVRDALGLAEDGMERAEAELAGLAVALADASPEQQVARSAAYADALARLESLAAIQPAAHEVEEVLAGLELDGMSLDTPVRHLSGGQKTRLGLARILLGAPQLLLLDEPTNHLDIAALRWLETWLARYRGAVLLVSHDREFLDRSVTGLLELEPQTHTMTFFPGRYQDYIDVKQRQLQQQWSDYKDQQQHIADVNAEIRRLAGYARTIENGTINFAIRKIAKGIAHRAVIQGRRLERELERQQVEKPVAGWRMKLDLDAAPTSGQDVLTLEAVSVGYGGEPLLRDIQQTVRAGERIALIGPNGCGKTTLLRVINGTLPPLAGRLRYGSGVKIGYFAQEGETLARDATPLDIIRQHLIGSETDARAFLHYFLFAGDDVFTRVGDLSLGERARLSLARLVAAGCNFLLLDEPLNHLDIPSQARFEQALAGFPGTILAVVHDRYFVRQFATRLWAIRAGALYEAFDLDAA
jgi:ATP-binding cassette subfamily F protein 3